MSETPAPNPFPASSSTPVSSPNRVAAVVVLAAGGGTRMKSSRSKLLHEVAGRSMLSYAIDAAAELEPEHLVVVVGNKREQVEQHLGDIAPHVRTVVQAEQRGTGHAVMCGLADLGELSGDIVVTYADVPMLTNETLADLVASHRSQSDAVTVLTARVPDPTGYGRIIRDDEAGVAGIVEHKDASEDQLAICEINSGIYAFDAAALRSGLSQITDDNAQGEYYLTDVLGVARRDGGRVGAWEVSDLWQTKGVNDRTQLCEMNAEMNRRVLEKWMGDGVSIQDPASTWIHDSVSLAEDVTLLAGTHLEGATTIGAGATIGPDTTLTDSEVGAGASVVRSQVSLAVIGPGATVGPFSYLRPGTQLGEGGKIGAFVETKNARIGAGAKVPHLTYAGDAVIGEGANIGAGTIFANYDGLSKATARVGAHSFIGSDSVLVAPVDVADGAYVAAGSAITGDVEAGQLAVARGRQRNVDGWVARKRPGSKTAAAAEAAGARSAEERPAPPTSDQQ